MFQEISQSLVVIVFLWGPLVNEGIWKGTHAVARIHKGGPCIQTNITSLSQPLAKPNPIFVF